MQTRFIVREGDVGAGEEDPVLHDLSLAEGAATGGVLDEDALEGRPERFEVG